MSATQMQYRAFLAVVLAALMVGLAPIVAAVILDQQLPDNLIAIADKSTIGFVGLLGTIGALLFRQNGTDERRADNMSKALDTVRDGIAASPPGTQQVEVVNDPTRPVPVEPS